MSFPYIVQKNNVTVVIGSTPHTISSSHIMYTQVLDAIKRQDWDTVEQIIEPKQVVINFGQGNIEIRDNYFYWRGQKMHTSISERMIAMIRDGFSVEPLANFIHNLMENPSNRSVEELYDFLERNNLPITTDGCFLAYKKVNDDYTDVYTKTVPNKPAHRFSEQELAQLSTTKFGLHGEVTVVVDQVTNQTEISMERNQVDDDFQQTCSKGLHFCSLEYLKTFDGARIVIVKVNPRDVVSIPVDYNRAKGRTCRYVVVEELGVEPDKAFNKAVQDSTTLNPPNTIGIVQDSVDWPQPVNYFS